MGIFQQFPYSNFHEMNLDQIIKIMREMQDEWENTKTEWASYKEFIDNYFANLDVTDEVLAAMRVFASDGTLNNIVDPVIVAAVIDWLADNITQPTVPVVDASLSIAGAAADAKATGDAIDAVRDDLDNLTDSYNERVGGNTITIRPTWINNTVDGNTGEPGSANPARITNQEKILVDPDVTISVKLESGFNCYYWYFINGAVSSRSELQTTDFTLTGHDAYRLLILKTDPSENISPAEVRENVTITYVTNDGEIPNNLRSISITPEMFGAKGDGITNDTTAVAAAINSAYKNILFNGTYKISQLSLSNLQKKKIYGKGTLLVSAPLDHDTAITFSNCNNVVIEGLTITTDIANTEGIEGDFTKLFGYGYTTMLIVNSEFVTVKNIKITNCTDGIRLNLSKYSSVENCDISHCGEEPIIIKECNCINIHNNYLYNHCGDCILMKIGDGSYSLTEQYSIKDNIIIHASRSENWINKGGGITLNYEDGATRNAKDIIISGNQIYDTYYGIALFSIDNGVVSNNVIDAIANGIEFRNDEPYAWSDEPFKNCIVSNNIVASATRYGYRLIADVEQCLAIGNIARWCTGTFNEDWNLYGNLIPT